MQGCRGKPARAQRLVKGQRDARNALTRCRIDHRGQLPDMPGEMLGRAHRIDIGGIAHRHARQIAFRQTRLHFQLAIARNAEQRAAARADDLAGFDLPGQHQTRFGRNDVQPCGACAQLAQCGARHAHLGHGGIARGPQLFDIGVGNEPVGDELQRPVKLALRQAGIGFLHLYSGCLAGNFFGLDRTVDHRQHLALVDPAAGIDQHLHHFAAFAGDAHRQIAPRRQGAAGRYRALYRDPARHHDRDGLGIGVGLCRHRRGRHL